MIRILKESKYKDIMEVKAPIHLDTLRQFWANVEIHTTKKVVYAITSKVGETILQISPTTICAIFGLNDLDYPATFPIKYVQDEFIERSYEGQLTGKTIFKPNFPADMKFFFHTLLLCLSAKTTAFNEIPLSIRYLGYAILTKSDFKFSQVLFNDLVSNFNNMKKGKCFLMHPRLLSIYIQSQVSKKDATQGVICQIGSLTHETFTRITNQSKILKTQVDGAEQTLNE
ncbi:hypothetical protein Hanom_Chr14g01260711 [Helianthus anomalus]